MFPAISTAMLDSMAAPLEPTVTFHTSSPATRDSPGWSRAASAYSLPSMSAAYTNKPWRSMAGDASKSAFVIEVYVHSADPELRLTACTLPSRDATNTEPKSSMRGVDRIAPPVV